METINMLKTISSDDEIHGTFLFFSQKTGIIFLFEW